MAKPATFPEADMLLKAPVELQDSVAPLPAYASKPHDSGGPFLISCWQLSDEEIEEVKRTGKVWLSVLGGMQPPVGISGISPWKGDKRGRG